MLKRILCALLASMMLLGTLASCGETQEPTDTSAGSSAGTSTDSAATEEETRESLDLPDTRFDKQELTFLTRDESEWTTLEIFAEELTSSTDNINNAVYQRNLRILEDYGVTVKEFKVETGTQIAEVQKETAGNSGDFQAIITNTSNSASLASNGHLWDLNSESIEYLHLSKSWWDQNMVNGMSINGRLFYATGDLLTADNDATFCLLFNKQIAKDNQLPDMYALVENKEWTMEKFYEVIQKGVKEMDGKPGLSYDSDVAGFGYTGDNPYCLMFAGGITLCQKNADDYPEYKLDVERASNIADIGKKIFDKSHALDMNAAVTGANTIMQVGQLCFGENHALFIGEVMQAVTRMRGYSVDFGILPYPMYDTKQDNYYSMMHLTASQVSIPKSVVDKTLTMTTSMIEAMAYHSVDTLTVQYYDINLKSKGAKDEQSAPMIDKILASRVCDLSYYFNWGSGAYGSLSSACLPTSNVGIASLDKKFSKLLPREIDKVIKAMDKNAVKSE